MRHLSRQSGKGLIIETKMFLSHVAGDGFKTRRVVARRRVNGPEAAERVDSFVEVCSRTSADQQSHAGVWLVEKTSRENTADDTGAAGDEHGFHAGPSRSPSPRNRASMTAA